MKHIQVLTPNDFAVCVSNTCGLRVGGPRIGSGPWSWGQAGVSWVDEVEKTHKNAKSTLAGIEIISLTDDW